MVRIKFHNLVVSPVYGNCAPGDIVSCDEAFARHCVETLRSATYLQAITNQPATSPAGSPPPKKGRKQ